MSYSSQPNNIEHNRSHLSSVSIRRLPALPGSPSSSSSDESDLQSRRPSSPSSTHSSDSDDTILPSYYNHSWKRESRRSSKASIRPLPPIPRALRCRRCATSITSVNLLLPLNHVCAVTRPSLSDSPLNAFSNRYRKIQEDSGDSRGKHLYSQKCKLCLLVPCCCCPNPFSVNTRCSLRLEQLL